MIEHPRIANGWFRELSDDHFPGQALMLKVEEVLHHSKSEFQDILLFKSAEYGNVLVLDGIIQCTERDEFAYQEMISHVPLYSHKNPKKILVIGGGDGGVIREVVKHSCVESVTLVEIDRTVIELSEKYLPKMSSAFNHPKVDVKLCDGFKFLKETAGLNSVEKYDVIITDSSDPDGPAEAFFQKEYFQLIFNALKKDGIMIAQASENIWLDLNYLKNLMKTSRSIFKNTQYCYTMVPTYTSGQLGLIVCSKDETIDITVPQRKPDIKEQGLLRYYNPDIHSASFVLPTWANTIINVE
ncbi:hypothetical protein Kpol_397p12 [Vanderwaltozyma polyspora DSM 70294]|uniref:PABS domain-containing protein n=1 Tax=Vanderwaltozyma polyspora (strain ATCC 22028 / DSM 70294 / BCRC 21397 / CBS 2163 / NBRC 10782 / NRRL Y-8283 / UCD 57-17) TaxID=436907 RepID=A7TRG3_VANPO|nr:uncharacterized protein Kpol_397p12 [Vanderwaltozyma polyspora DSM 70294]EDO15152.1 hypothetical protein Kpol_397p12 [Vanderwaltozyma polyspora DSM 70294]